MYTTEQPYQDSAELQKSPTCNFRQLKNNMSNNHVQLPSAEKKTV